MRIRTYPKTLVVLCGPAGAGKSTLAAQHFAETQIVSSDRCRGLICDDPQNQDINRQTFELFHHILRLRLSLGRLSVADSTALESSARRPLLEMAHEAGFATCLLVFAFPPDVCRRQNALRAQPVPHAVISQQYAHLRRHTLSEIRQEPWDKVIILEEWPSDLRFGRPRTRGVHCRSEAVETPLEAEEKGRAE